MTERLRTAQEEDMNILFQWANEAEVRKNSFSTDTISYEEHEKWYQNILRDSNCRQYIYEYNGEALGQVRLTIKQDTAEISYSICAEKRGKGYGKRMLRLLQETVKQEYPNLTTVSAKVKPENIASQSVFSDLGYKEKYKTYELKLNENQH